MMQNSLTSRPIAEIIVIVRGSGRISVKSGASANLRVGSDRRDVKALYRPVDRRRHFERLVRDLSKTFILLPVGEIDDRIIESLARVAVSLDFNAAAMTRFSNNGDAAKVTHIWTIPDIPPIPAGFTENDFPWLARRLVEGKPVLIPSVERMPAEALTDRNTFGHFDCRSSYHWPLKTADGVIGCVSVLSMRIPRPFPEEFRCDMEFVADVFTNALARKRAEEELQRHRTELAHVSRLSTMGALTASLAHELNQPLGAILTNAQAGLRFLIGPNPNIAEVQGALEDIVQDTRRAGDVISQMRALVRKDDPRLQPLDLNQVVRQVVRLLHSDMVIRKVKVTLDLDAALSPVNGDGVQLQQVTLNLVLNAFDAIRDMPEGRRTVIVRTRHVESGQAQVDVCDRGTGISSQRLGKLFEPFRSSKREGLGLGLSISHSIIEAHKGRLWAENNSGQGATFHFSVPVHVAEARSRRTAAATAKRPAPIASRQRA